jgi:hypothetical protein
MMAASRCGGWEDGLLLGSCVFGWMNRRRKGKRSISPSMKPHCVDMRSANFGCRDQGWRCGNQIALVRLTVAT